MATKYELSKTYQYRKVMKPLLERKRRARINKCLDELKDLIAEYMKQESGDPNVKLEKADILELTVQKLRTIKAQKQSASHSNSNMISQQSFRSGYIQAANEVSRCLATLPKVDVTLGTKLMTHLGLRLNQLESVDETPLASSTPLSIITSQQAHSVPMNLYSPVSSGYASDSDNSRSSRSSRSSPALYSKGLLQVAAPVWRPW